MYEKKEKYPSSQLMVNLKLVNLIACFSFAYALCVLSSKNPFSNNIIGEFSTYFDDTKGEISVIENKMLNNDSSHNQKTKIKKYKNIRSEKHLRKKKFLRQLVLNSFCLEIRNNFIEFKGKKFSNIFGINYERIFNICLGNLVISGLLLFNGIFFIFEEKIIAQYNKLFQSIFSVFILLLYDIRFLLSIILYHYIEKGDIETYDDFLKCKNVNTKFFDTLFSSYKYLRKCFIIFFILNAISLIINKSERCFKIGEKEEEMPNEI